MAKLPYLRGCCLIQADLILLPFMERFKLIACEMHGFDAEEALGPAVSAWLVRLQMNACRRTIAHHCLDVSLTILIFDGA